MSFTGYALRRYNPCRRFKGIDDLTIGELHIRISFEKNYIDPDEKRTDRLVREALIAELESLKERKWKALLRGDR